GWKRIEERPRSLETPRRLLVEQAARISRVEPLQPRCRVRPSARIVAGHSNRRSAVAIQRPETAREFHDRLVLLKQRVVFVERALRDQNRLRQVGGIDDNELCRGRRGERHTAHSDDQDAAHATSYGTRATVVVAASSSYAGNSRSLVR